MNEETESTAPKGTMLAPDEITDWGNQTRIIEPGVHGEDGSTVKDGGETETPEEDPTEEEVETPVETPVEEEPTPQETIEDPGEFKPKDYSFDVTTYDEEGKNGKTVKITSVDQWDQLLDSDANLGTGAAVGKALRLASKMESNLERDQEAWQASKSAYDLAVEADNTRVASINNMANEIEYLVGKGQLPAVAAQYKDADWRDPEVAKQPGVKEQVELLSYMRNENNSRQRAGLMPMTSILDAYNAFQVDEARKTQQTAKRTAGEARKTAGAKVAGSSPNPTIIAPKGVAVGDPNAWARASMGDWAA